MSDILRLLRRVDQYRRHVAERLCAKEENLEKIGSLFRTARVVANLSLRETAQRLGISDVQLGEYERGVKSPRMWRPLFEQLTPNMVRCDTTKLVEKAVREERKAVVDHLREHARGYRHANNLDRAHTLEKKADQISRGEHRS